MGQIDPRRLYVLLDGKVPPGLAGRATILDGVTIIAPAGADRPVVPGGGSAAPSRMGVR
jgi:hypothetical protein